MSGAGRKVFRRRSIDAERRQAATVILNAVNYKEFSDYSGLAQQIAERDGRLLLVEKVENVTLVVLNIAQEHAADARLKMCFSVKHSTL